MTRSITVPSHEHKTFDVKPLGECRACDNFHERAGVTGEAVETAMATATPRGALRLLAMLGRVDRERHDQVVEWLRQGQELADAVDEIFGENEA